MKPIRIAGFFLALIIIVMVIISTPIPLWQQIASGLILGIVAAELCFDVE